MSLKLMFLSIRSMQIVQRKKIFNFARKMRPFDMSWQSFCALLFLILGTLTVSSGALYLMYRMHLSSQKTIESLQVQLRDLTNLAASKNLEAYAQLQRIPSLSEIREVVQSTTANYDPNLLDDASVARSLMDKYIAAGQNPNDALDLDAVNDFGDLFH